MTLTAIVAMTPDRIIGRGGDLPWHLPEDFKFFKRTTTGHPIVMGRKTYESIGKPLPKRQNIILTRDQDWDPGIPSLRSRDDTPSVIDSAPAASLDLAKPVVIHNPHELQTLPLQDPHVFIIGGAQVYSLFLPILDDLLVSWVFEKHDGDTCFPEFAARFPHYEVLESHHEFEVRRYQRDLATD